MRFLKALLFVFAVSTLSVVASAQTPTDSTTASTQKFKITKHDGTTYIGTIISDDGREVLINTDGLGKIYIPKADIKSMKPITEGESLVEGGFREAGPFTTRYYFTNNALPIKKGEDYAMVHLYGPEVHFSVANNFSIGVMATWIASPIGLALKLALPTQNEKINFSLGTIMMSSGYLFGARGYGGLHWGSFTYGERGKNFTISTGLGYIDFTGDNGFTAGSVSSLAGIAPVGEKASFIFDSMIGFKNKTTTNTVWDPITGIGTPVVSTGLEMGMFLMPGMRFQSSDRRAFQVALAGVIYNNFANGNTLSFPVPMCSWFFKF